MAVFCFGLCSFPVHSLCVAHTNDFVGPTEYVEVSSGLLLVFAAGAVIGPLFASSAVQAVGVDGLFGFTAAVHFCLVVFVLLRLRVRARPPVEERVEFADALRSVGTVGPVDPRFDGDVEQAEGSVEAAEPAAER